ncbi:Discoidin, CUB and LCCL domain-containing protein 1-like protein [Aix galericulata]|nr:Discoidin, CUB and LCCL domain-containing protein 1-like protein [Aix galericulata]
MAQGAPPWLGATPSPPSPPYPTPWDGCGHTVLAARSGTLSSRNYPGTYPNHTACRWRLRAPPGTSLLLVFGDLDLEPSERCARSSLLLTDPDSGATYGTGGTPRWCRPGGGGARMADFGKGGTVCAPRWGSPSPMPLWGLYFVPSPACQAAPKLFPSPSCARAL